MTLIPGKKYLRIDPSFRSCLYHFVGYNSQGNHVFELDGSGQPFKDLGTEDQWREYKEPRKIKKWIMIRDNSHDIIIQLWDKKEAAEKWAENFDIKVLDIVPFEWTEKT